jgi:hypothetical protein
MALMFRSHVQRAVDEEIVEHQQHVLARASAFQFMLG